MKTVIVSVVGCLALGACAQTGAPRAASGGSPAPAPGAAPEAAIAACKSALALKQSVNPVFVLPVSSAAIPGGREVFLSLKGQQWLCMTDAYGNVSRLESRR
ncbi:hypothetical protein ACILG0_03830 [Pseudomonadota bacterium AL_CKDN230030165-1A_HGKHYDSX7]